MGPIPPVSERTAEALDRIRRTQDGIESYRATVTETTVTQLPNGSERRSVRTWRVWVKYTDDGVLTRLERPAADSPGETRIHVRNRTASVRYDPGQDEYLIDRSGGATDAGGTDLSQQFRSDGGEYNLFTAPLSTVERENAIRYNGTDRIRNRTTDVIHLDGNPNGGNLAYYAAQTLWVDPGTGLVLRHTAQKPHLDSMANTTVRELRDPENYSVWNDSDDRPNAVYLGDKTVTTTYTNVSVNTVPTSVFTPDVPAGADVEHVDDGE